MTELFAFFSCGHTIPAKLTSRIAEYGAMRNCYRKTHILQEGQVCRNLYFVESGVLRKYYKKGTKEITSGFMAQGDCCIAEESFFTQQPGIENIEVLEKGVLSYISYDALQALCRDFPTAGEVTRKMLEYLVVVKCRRQTALWMQSAELRYEWYTTHFSEMERMVPAKLLASYLGLTEVTLSVVKKARQQRGRTK